MEDVLSSRRVRIQPTVDVEEELLVEVLRCKNAKAPWLGIEQSELEAAQKVTTEAKAAGLAKQ